MGHKSMPYLLRRAPFWVFFCLLAVVVVTCLYVAYGREIMCRSVHYKPYSYTQHRLSNGMEVLLIKEEALPSLTFDILFKTGPDPQGKEGLTYLLAELMDKGTKNRSATKVTEDLEVLGAGFAYNLTRDGLAFSIGTLPYLHKDLLKIFSEIIQTPAFSEEEFQRAKEKALGWARRSPESFSFYANRVFNQYLYEPHPYGFYVNGSLKSLATLKLEDIKKFYESRLHPQNAVMTVAGRHPEDIVAQLESLFGQWKAGTDVKDQTKQPKVLKIKSAKKNLLIVDQPSAIQSEIRMGHISVKRSHPDFLALMSGNVILGHSSSSRLSTRIREQQGLTYHVYSVFSAKKELGAFKAGMAVRNNKLGTGLLEMMGVIEDFHKNGITGEELKKAKQLLKNSFITEVSTVDSFAGYLLYLNSQGIPYTYVDQFFKKLEGLTLEEVNKAIKKHLKTDQIQTLILTNAKQVQSQLKDFEPFTIKNYKSFL